jgi:N-acyl homoserine lactone hydrolase
MTRMHRRRRIARWALICLASLLAAAIALVAFGMRGRPSAAPRATHRLGPQHARSWEEVFEGSPRVPLCTLDTGRVGGSRAMLLRSDHAAHDVEHDADPLPVFAHLVSHPSRGQVLVDSGLSAAFGVDTFGDIPAPLRWAHAALGTHFSQRRGRDVRSQLDALGAAPHTIFFTHLHGDHTAGVPALDANIRLVAGRGEADDPASHLGYGHIHRTIEELDFSRGVAMPPFDRVLDLFGDGSLLAIATPGHSRGHVSYLVRAREGAVLLTGDASHTRWAFEHGVGPRGPSSDDETRGQRSLDQMRAFVRAHPNVRVIQGHEAERFGCEVL